MSTTTYTAPREISEKPRLSKVLVGSLVALGLVIALAAGVVAYYASGGADSHVGEPGPVSEPATFTQ